jgi:DNA-nicking Smr family endonuclease
MTTDKTPGRRRRLTDDEHRLWRGITRGVAPLKRAAAKSDLADTGTPIETPPKTLGRKRASLPVAHHPAPKPVPPLAPLDRRSKQRLARGSEPIGARIDLHGRTQAQAHAALLRFLHRAQHDGAKFVLVITGKGSSGANGYSGERGVLKRQVPLWLRLPEFRPYVVGFEDAHIGHGGEGALYVRLRRQR